MANTPRYLSSTSGFVPQATGQVISYIRRPDKFAVNRYAQMIESPATVGLYAQVDRDTPARIVSDAEFAWEDGADRPNTPYNQLSWNWVPFTIYRRDYMTKLGDQALELAKDSWKPLEQHTGALAQQAMTNRTNRVITLGQNTANWGNNTADANTLNGGRGTWDRASDDPQDASYNAIKRALMEALKRVVLATNACVSIKDLRLIVSPGLAEAMANSAEIHNYMKFAAHARQVLEGKEPLEVSNEQWGLPVHLYGIELIVEETPIVTDRPSAGTGTGTSVSSNRTFAKGDTSAIICSRVGGIDGIYGSQSFSTFQLYFYEYNLAVEVFKEPKHRYTEVHVVEQFQEVLAAPESGFLITNCI
jgi:hypothetical protein